MENYIVSARKYRPATFDEVVGQQALTTTLKNAIATGKLAHAYLFCGPRGVGKTTCARIFAKTINCLHPKPGGEACGACESCRSFDEQRSYNIHELDAASNNSVEDIRQLIEQVRIPPQVGKYKVFIIDEVHMLSSAAFNAFLKTLEEPPAHAIFILATTEKHKILPTILSRCQIYDFSRMEVGDIVAHLERVAAAEGIAFEPEALNVIARKADGGMRDALSIFDQVASFTNGNITYKKVIEDLNVLDYDYYFAVTDALLKPDIPQAMLTLNEILAKGFEGNYFIGGLASHFRDLLVARDAATLPLLDVAESVRERYREQAARCRPQFLYKALRLCNSCDVNYRASYNKRLLVELTLIEVAQLSDDESPGSGPGPTKKLKPLFTATAPAPQPAAPAAPQPAPAQPAARPAVAAAPQPLPAPRHAAAPAAPATQPAAAAAPATPRRTPGVPHTVSIRATLEALETERTQPAEVAQLAEPTVDYGNSSFQESDVNYQWMRYANQLPREKTAMASRMKNIYVKLLDGGVVDVPVENQQVLAYMEEMHADLEKFMRSNLKNGNVHLRFRLLEEKEQHRAYTRKEQMEAMLKKSSALVQLREALHLELA